MPFLQEPSDISPIQLRDFLSNYCKTKQDALGDFNEDELEGEGNQGEHVGDIDDSEESNVDEKKKIPGHFQAVLTVSYYVLYLKNPMIFFNWLKWLQYI